MNQTQQTKEMFPTHTAELEKAPSVTHQVI